MKIAPLPAFTAINRRKGLSASLFATVDHDVAPGELGLLNIAGASGAVSIVGGDIVGAPGDRGGRFDAASVAGGVAVSFDRSGLGDNFLEGESTLTRLSFTVTDGAKAAKARISVTVHRRLAPPALLVPIPDQLDTLP